MSKLKRHHINEVMDMHNLTKGKLGYSYVYYADDVDKVIEEKDKEIADLIEKNKRLARKDIIMASETIKDLEESHKMEVEQLLIEIAELQKQVHDYAQCLYVIQARADKESRHSKYKRSLTMAEWCNSGMVVETFACFRPRSTKEVWKEEHKYWAKWRKIWFELAKHYKEAK